MLLPYSIGINCKLSQWCSVSIRMLPYTVTPYICSKHQESLLDLRTQPLFLHRVSQIVLSQTECEQAGGEAAPSVFVVCEWSGSEFDVDFLQQFITLFHFSLWNTKQAHLSGLDTADGYLFVSLFAGWICYLTQFGGKLDVLFWEWFFFFFFMRRKHWIWMCNAAVDTAKLVS